MDVRIRGKFPKCTDAEGRSIYSISNPLKGDGDSGEFVFVVDATEKVIGFKVGPGVWDDVDTTSIVDPLEVEAIEEDILAINQDIATHETELIEHEAAILSRVKVITVASYADMVTAATGTELLIIAVTSDTVNMGGSKGAYMYIPSFGIGQIAINFI